jgi:glycerophosphoryl diester phosphodiesterase
MEQLMKKAFIVFLEVLAITLGVFFITILISAFIGKPAPEHPYYKNAPIPMVIAHQGGDNLRPGDTLVAFQNAVDLGADVLEMDAHITKDDQIVLMHDERVDRTSDGTGLIEELNLDELKKLDAAYKWSQDGGKTFPYRGQGVTIPTLEELFQKFPQVRYVIEIKKTQNSIDKPLCQLIREYNMQYKVLVASFHDDAMKNFRTTCPEVATSGSRNEVTPFVLLSKLHLTGFLLRSLKFNSLQVPYETSESYGIPIMTKQFIELAHARNIKIEPWTIDDPQRMKEYISWGVDGIITDSPDVMLKILNR